MKSRRLERTYKQLLNGHKEEIIKLLCPVREKEWLNGWDYSMVFSESGLAEKGCVFETDNDFGKYQWVMTQYDLMTFEVQFVKFIKDKMIVIIDIGLFEESPGLVACNIKYTLTALDDLFVLEMHENNTQEVFKSHMKLWEDSLNYFLKTGEMLV